MKNENSLFELGATVYMESGFTSTITKVLKNGRVKIGTSDTIYKINGKNAVSCSGYNVERIYGLTDQNVFEAQKKAVLRNSKITVTKKINLLATEIKRLQTLLHNTIDQDIINESIKIVLETVNQSEATK